MLGIIVTLISIIAIYVKSFIYSVIFCLQAIAFINNQVQTCLVCKSTGLLASGSPCAENESSYNFTSSLAQATIAAFIVNTMWFFLITKCMCFSKYTKTYDTIFALCNFTMILSFVTTFYGKFSFFIWKISWYGRLWLKWTSMLRFIAEWSRSIWRAFIYFSWKVVAQIHLRWCDL